MEKKKKTRFIVGWLLITAALLAGSLLVPGHGKSESVQEAMRDAVLHGTNRISLFGLKDVNPAYISSLVVVGVILLAALLPALRKLTEGYAALGAAAKKTLAGLIPELAALIEAAEDALR